MPTAMIALAAVAALGLVACSQSTGSANLPGTAQFTLPTTPTATLVEFTVVNATSGETVKVADQNPDKTGVTLTGLPAGTYNVVVNAEGFQPVTAQFKLAPDGRVVWITPLPTTLTPVDAGDAAGKLVLLGAPAGAYAYSGVVDRDANTPGLQLYVDQDYIQVVMHGMASTGISGTDYVQLLLPAGKSFRDGSFKVAAQFGNAPAGNPLTQEVSANARFGVYVHAQRAARVDIDVPIGLQVVTALEVIPTSTGQYCYTPSSVAGASPVCFEVINAPSPR
ncbi:PEGA domain-containing protein [Deinococcus peraridilitoris]|uniref:PEGA domain-containing protein n=1 Tax=Deinococcus peraridilitoris (strain DSM 19664 / LMG 22246 / CIP 109416 / KR-200) TaxID=937777 RepID=L0A1S2_DEIPD|nr:PEGA domain-containing protein [Deinococcus peraridilitoris]AFZ67404.1 PEGA domain-containing protein [Deinococcus peraridilitoris DSM 19664]